MNNISPKVQTPSWAYIIGVIMIFFGGCNFSSSLDVIQSDSLFDKYNELTDSLKIKKDSFDYNLDHYGDSLEHPINDDTIMIIDGDTTVINFPEQTIDSSIYELGSQLDNLEDYFLTSEYVKIWTKRFGYIGLILAILYLLGGVLLIIRTSFSIPWAYTILVLSIVFSIVEPLVLSAESGMNLSSLLSGFSGFFSIMIDFILLILIVSFDKEAYKTPMF